MSRETEKRNRRFEYIKRNRHYFSAEEIKIRNPNLYLEFVGKEEEVVLDSSMSLSERIFANIDQQHYEKEQEQEFESESEEDLEFLGKRVSLDSNGLDKEPLDSSKDSRKEELILYYKEMFLEGKDSEFDYSTVDLNPEYDDSIPYEQDQEEHYFEEFVEAQVNEKEYDY
jgi:small-conductance mechanosensitive channel